MKPSIIKMLLLGCSLIPLCSVLQAQEMPSSGTAESDAQQQSQSTDKGESTSTTPVVAQRRIVDLAYGAFQRRDYKTARSEAMKRFTENNKDTAAMTLLGVLYANGWGVDIPDLKTAQEWFLAAAKLGDSGAMSELGLMSLTGRGVKKDPQMAKEWFEKAALLHEPIACHNLALILLNNNDQEARAVELLKTAARAGIVEAQHDLGTAYLIGRGAEQSYANAALWFGEAASQGNTASEIEYAILLYKGQGLQKDEALAAKMFLRAAYKGNPIAQNRIARLYTVGRGVSKDLAEAAAWHQVASMHGLTDPVLNSELVNLTKDEIERADRLAKERIALQ